MTIQAFRVGGWVRDHLLGIPSQDVDYVVEAPFFAAMVEWVKSQGTIFCMQRGALDGACKGGR